MEPLLREALQVGASGRPGLSESLACALLQACLGEPWLSYCRCFLAAFGEDFPAQAQERPGHSWLVSSGTQTSDQGQSEWGTPTQGFPVMSPSPWGP